MKKLLLTSVVILLVSGCIATKTTSYINPTQSAFQPKKVLVFANLGLEYREYFEQKLVEQLLKAGVQASRSIDVFPPIQEYTADQLNQRLDAEGFDATLIAEVGDADSQRNVVGMNTYSTASATSYGNSAYASGYSSSVPIVAASSTAGTTMTLINRHTGETVYVGHNRTNASGTLYVGNENMLDDAARATVEDLKKKGILPTKAR